MHDNITLSDPMRGTNVGTLQQSLSLSQPKTFRLPPPSLPQSRIKHHNTSPLLPLSLSIIQETLHLVVFHIHRPVCVCVCNLAPETEVYEWSSETVGL